MTKFVSWDIFIASNIPNFLKSIDSNTVLAANEEKPEKGNLQMSYLNMYIIFKKQIQIIGILIFMSWGVLQTLQCPWDFFFKILFIYF